MKEFDGLKAQLQTIKEEDEEEKDLSEQEVIIVGGQIPLT